MDKIFDFILIIICIIFNALIFILSKDYNIKITIITFIFLFWAFNIFINFNVWCWSFENIESSIIENTSSSLISEIAHQLKTPLTNMKMYSEFLQDDDLSEEDRKEFNKVILLSLNKLCFKT